MTLAAWTYVPQGSPSPDLYNIFEYTEQINSGSVSVTQGNNGVTRTFMIPDDQLTKFLDDLLGWSDVGNTGLVERVLPDPHPTWNNFYAMEASVERQGIGPILQYADQTARSKVAKVTAVYKPVDFEIVDDDPTKDEELYRFVTRSMLPAGEYFTIDSTGMFMVNNVGPDGRHKSLSTPPGRITGTSEITMTWHVVPPSPFNGNFIPPNLASITDCLGKVNEVAFDPTQYDFPAGTVLFLACEPRLICNRVTTGASNYNFYWEIALKFLYRNNGLSALTGEYAGHQYIWDQGNKRWDLITHDGTLTGNRLYETADLNELFTID